MPDDIALGYADPYLAAIAYEDAQIARVVEYLDRRGLLDESLIVVTGDHGESLGEHGEESHGIFVYDEALRVPLIVRGPGIEPRRVSAAVRLIDVMPTVLDFLGLPIPSMQGVTLTRLMSGAEENPREVYAESRYPERFGWSALRALRVGRLKVIEAPRPELFDVVADPREQHNLYDSNRRDATVLLDRLRAMHGKPEAVASVPMDRAQANRLASLGYVAAVPRQPASTRALADPKDMIEAFNHMTRKEAERATPVAAGCAQTIRFRSAWICTRAAVVPRLRALCDGPARRTWHVTSQGRGT